MPKITDLNEYTTPTFSDILPIVDLVGNETKKITKQSLLKNVESETILIGSMGNTVSVDEGGNFRLNGEATQWNDLFVPLTQTRIGSNLRPDFNQTELTFDFPQNDPTEILYFNIQVPHTWKQGTIVYPHVHWKQTQNLFPTFKLDYKWFNIGDVVPATWSTYVMGIGAKPYIGSAMHQINEGVGGIDGTGKTLSSMLLCKLYRDDNVYTGDALTYQFDVHIQIDSFGSELEYIKD